jgi:hypothetical protein
MTGGNALFFGRVAGCSPPDPGTGLVRMTNGMRAWRRRRSVTFQTALSPQKPRRERNASLGVRHGIGSFTTSRYSREHDQINHNIASSVREYL